MKRKKNLPYPYCFKHETPNIYLIFLYILSIFCLISNWNVNIALWVCDIFLSIASWHSEVVGADLFACGKFVYNHYHDCKDTNYLLCSDRINDVLCLPVSSSNDELTPILACNDRVLRVLKVSKCNPVEFHYISLCMINQQITTLVKNTKN